MDEEGISWSILTHEHKDRSPDWYWTFGILTLVGIGVSVYFLNILLAIILAVGSITIIILSVRGPREHEVHLGPRGVTMDGTLYRYPSIHSFWVSIEHAEDASLELEPRARLFFKTSGYLHPRIMVPLDDTTHAEEVREYLLQYLEEEEQEPHFAEHLAELAGL